jgi:hypothetical protein
VARAQTGTGTGTGTGANTGIGTGIANPANQGFQITNPAANLGFGGTAPFSGFVNGFDPTFNNGFFPGFTPGFGVGFFNPFFGGAFNLTPNYGPLQPGIPRAMTAASRVPVLGVSAPPASRLPNRMSRNAFGPEAARRLAGGPDGPDVAARSTATGTEDVSGQGAAEVHTGTRSDDQNRLASEVESLMRDRPLRSGTITGLSGDRMQVEYLVNGETRTATLPMDQVFFFRANGQMTTAAMDTRGAQRADHVLIPEPESIRQSVAGSRQQTRGTARRVTPKKRTNSRR